VFYFPDRTAVYEFFRPLYRRIEARPHAFEEEGIVSPRFIDKPCGRCMIERQWFFTDNWFLVAKA
jgi:hypothetical protein